MKSELDKYLEVFERLIHIIEDDEKKSIDIFQKYSEKISAKNEDFNIYGMFTELAALRNFKSTFLCDCHDPDSFQKAAANIYKNKTGKILSLDVDYEIDYDIEDLISIARSKFEEENLTIWLANLNSDDYSGFSANKFFDSEIHEISRNLGISLDKNGIGFPKAASAISINETENSINKYIDYEFAPPISKTNTSNKNFIILATGIAFIILLYILTK